MKNITKKDYENICKLVQQAVDEKFRKMVSLGPMYTVTVSGGSQKPKTYPALGLCGFAWIKFKGAKVKNQLEQAGFRVSKDYPTGFGLHIDYKFNQEMKKLHPYAEAEYQQDIDLKEVACETALKFLENNFDFVGYVHTQLD